MIRNPQEDESFNSALYWFPRILKAGLPVPRTEFVLYDHRLAVNWLEGESNAKFVPIGEVARAAEIVGYPVFIRTDLASAKHNGKIAYRANRPEHIERVLRATVEDNEMKFWIAPVSPKAFMVREWLQLDGAFDAFGGHLISKEFRYFASKDGVICRHFYWPENAIQFYGGKASTEPPKWREKLAGMAGIKQAMDEALSKVARAAAAACPAHERWSVDLALDVDGKWWLTDMALMEESFHVSGCPNKLTTQEDGP